MLIQGPEEIRHPLRGTLHHHSVELLVYMPRSISIPGGGSLSALQDEATYTTVDRMASDPPFHSGPLPFFGPIIYIRSKGHGYY
jgi:hypothetical protein